MDWIQIAEDILDVITLEDVLNEQDMTEAHALALLLENGLVDYPEWYKAREGHIELRPSNATEEDAD